MREEHQTALESQHNVFMAALDIYDRRRRVRGDAWLTVEDVIGDLTHHIESKLTRVKSIADRLPEFATQEELDEAQAAFIDDLLDLINYAAFLHRWMKGERRK